MKYRVIIANKDRRYDALQWCLINVGKRLIDWDFTTLTPSIEFYFRKEQDAIMFTLVWS